MTLLDIGLVLIGFIGGIFCGYLVHDLFKEHIETDVIEPYFKTDGTIAGFRKKG